MCVERTSSVSVMCFADGRQFFTVDFGSSLNRAVLKLYPAVDEASTVSSVCMKFNVDTSSSSVQLRVAVADTSEDKVDHAVSNHQSFTSGRHSVTVIRGRQNVVFTAEKIKVTRTSDAVSFHSIVYADGPCKTRATCKLKLVCTCIIIIIIIIYLRKTQIKLTMVM